VGGDAGWPARCRAAKEGRTMAKDTEWHFGPFRVEEGYEVGHAVVAIHRGEIVGEN